MSAMLDWESTRFELSESSTMLCCEVRQMKRHTINGHENDIGNGYPTDNKP